MKKRKQAVALHYKGEGEVPTVVASGFGEYAKRILDLAKEHDIPIAPHPELIQTLGRVRSGMHITSESFGLVAQVIAFLYHIDEKWRKSHGFLDSLLGGGEVATSTDPDDSDQG